MVGYYPPCNKELVISSQRLLAVNKGSTVLSRTGMKKIRLNNIISTVFASSDSMTAGFPIPKNPSPTIAPSIPETKTVVLAAVGFWGLGRLERNCQ